MSISWRTNDRNFFFKEADERININTVDVYSVMLMLTSSPMKKLDSDPSPAS